VSDRDRIAELEHRLRETNGVLARLANVVRRMATELRDLPGVNRASPAWRELDELVREIEQNQGR
jgi:hypothetical protein